jgi:hypothetical protein
MRDSEKGLSLVEVLVSLLLVTVVLFGLLQFTGTAYSQTRHNTDRQFAVQKAISMLEELKSLVQVQGDSTTVLDGYDDGTAFKNVLTVDRTITDPKAAPSNNVFLPDGTWKYTRQVTVSLLPGTTDPNVRLVNVKVLTNQDANADGNRDLLAEVAGVIRTAAGNYAPTQVYDVYALAIENVPGWWVYMANLIPFMQNAFQNLQARNPGLEFRVHWITKLSYGRDAEYRPQINSAVDSRQPIDNVYFYPGRMPTGQAVDYYYPPDNFKGHVLVDSTDTNGYDATTNPYPYALADTYNHAMRYADELALFQSRLAAGDESDDAPTLRILLERLYAHPDQYRNAIFINLHGELFPFPPIRNYSDAAKDPATSSLQRIRVVTHPERLHYPSTASSIRLRVYSYRTDPTGNPATNADWLGQNAGIGVPITVTLKGVSWNPVSGSSDVVAIRGGTDQDGTAGADAYQAVNATTTASAAGMYYASTVSGGDTILSLYNSPLKAPEVNVSGNLYGIHTSMRLYGLEYLPAPSEDLTGTTPPTAFSSNLTSAHGVSAGMCSSGECTPNTARWIITIPDTVLPGGPNGNGRLTVETRIDSTTSGTRTNHPPNLSRTYVWKGTDTWTYGDGTAANPPNLPVTEMYQIIGDPRHNPYADLKYPHETSGRPNADRLGMGYNRYFDDFENSLMNKLGAPWWKGYAYTIGIASYGVKNDATFDNDGWSGANGYVELDMNRIYQVLRTIVAMPRTVFTTMTGYSYYYCGMGNEIGYDSANTFPNSIPVDAKLTTGNSGAVYEQSILPSTTQGVKYVRENVSAPYWWSLYWLGELYPDGLYAGANGWAAKGNLPTGTGSGTFVRTLRGSIASSLPLGTTLINTGRRTGPEGSTDFYWSGSASSTFHHEPSTGTGDLQPGGTEIASRYNYPLSNGIAINRPFAISVNNMSNNPNHFLQAPYGPVYTATYQSHYYNHSVQTSDDGSAFLSLAGSGDNVGFVSVNGISMTGESGTSFIANWSLLTLIQGFLTAGRYNPSNAFANHVEQVPRISITSPNATTNLTNPSAIGVGWTREWLRWDGQSYTAAYPGGYAESTALSYAMLYSADNGATWKYMQDDSPATPGVRPASGAYLISSGSATPTYSWSVPAASFPQGTYLIRVEAYRDTLPLHYAYHQYAAFIRRG